MEELDNKIGINKFRLTKNIENVINISIKYYTYFIISIKYLVQIVINLITQKLQSIILIIMPN